MTAVWADLEDIPEDLDALEDVRSRAHELLWTAYQAARQAPPGSSWILFRAPVRTIAGTEQTYKMVVGPGDEAEPGATILRPDED